MGKIHDGAGDWLILQAMDDGHESVPAIAKAAHVRAALNRLRTTGKVRRYGNTKHSRYIRVKRRRKASR